MLAIGSNEILLLMLMLFLTYTVAAMFAADGWVIYRLFRGRRVLPAGPLVDRRPVPWGIWTVLLTILLFAVVTDGCREIYGRITARHSARRSAAQGAAPPVAAQKAPPAKAASAPESAKSREKRAAVENAPAADSKPADHRGKDLRVSISSVKPMTAPNELSITEQMVIGAAIDLTLLITLPLLLRLTSRAPLRDLGLSFKRWWQQAAVGIVALLAIHPVVTGVQLGMTKIWDSNAHPLQKMVLDEFSPGVPQLAILVAVFVAPVFEEIMFRGIIQSWLARLGSVRRGKSTPILSGSQAIATTDALGPGTDWGPHPSEFAAELGADLSPPDRNAGVPVESSGRGGRGLAAIVVTSLIFAAVHGPQWPAPIALFILSVTIGYVYQRTGSLIAAICMHATFNGISTLMLLWVLLLPQSAQHPEIKVAKPALSMVHAMTSDESACMAHKK